LLEGENENAKPGDVESADEPDGEVPRVALENE